MLRGKWNNKNYVVDVNERVKKMKNSEYIMSSLEEYFEILDRENKKRSELVAKSLVKYLQKSKEANKFERLQIAK